MKYVPKVLNYLSTKIFFKSYETLTVQVLDQFNNGKEMEHPGKEDQNEVF